VDLVLKGRGVRITEHLRREAERRLAKLERRPRPPVIRYEVEIITEGSPRVDGGHRVQMACHTARKAFRSEGAGKTIEAALDQAADRLDRQLATYRSKRESRLTGRGMRVQSAGTSPEEPSPEGWST